MLNMVRPSPVKHHSLTSCMRAMVSSTKPSRKRSRLSRTSKDRSSPLSFLSCLYFNPCPYISKSCTKMPRTLFLSQKALF